MHVTTKEIDRDGTHILTSVVEGDGPNPICSEDAKLTATVISISRTASGGVQVQTALSIAEPTSAAPTSVDPDADLLAYLAGKGFNEKDARADIAKYGADRVRAAKAKDDAAAAAKLDEELANKLGLGDEEESKPAEKKNEVVQ